MEENAIFKWIIGKLPGWAGGLAVTIFKKVVTCPYIRMELLPPTTLQDGNCLYLYYAVKVKNIGGSIAKSCWPRLLEVSDANFIPQAISWGTDFLVTPSKRKTFDMEPNDINYFAVAWTSQTESEQGLLVGNITLVRRKGVNHYCWLFMPGTETIKVDIVGKNFSAKPMKFKVQLVDKGADTWKMLIVEKG